MPPPVGFPQHNTYTNSNNNDNNPNTASAAATFDTIEIALPTTTMEANFSTLSAWSAADDDFNDSPSAAKRDYAENTAGTNNNDDDSHEDAVAITPPPPQLTKIDSY